MVGPAQEHVGDYGGGRRWVGAEPLLERVAKAGESAHHGSEAAGGEIDGVLDAGGDGGVLWKGEDEGGDGIGVGGEEGGEEAEVFGGDEKGDGEAAGGELVGEI